MNLKKFGLKVLSVAIAMVMLMSVCAPVAISAAELDEKNEINYVSLGDSMTNGYGLDGYNGNTGVEDYGYLSYANQFAEWLKEYKGADAVNHAQLAMSAMRAEDLHWLLELDYTDAEAIALTDAAPNNAECPRLPGESYASWASRWWEEVHEERWNAKFTTGDFWTWKELCDDYRLAVAAYAIKNDGKIGKITTGEAAIVAEYYQNAIENGDIVSLGMGNGNFGVFMFGRITEAIEFDGVPADAMIYDIQNAIRELDPEMQKVVNDLIDEMYAVLAENGFVADDGDDTTTSTMEALINTVVYTGISYVLNYAGSVEAILQLNDDAEIILVALMNTFADNSEFPTGTTEEVIANLSIGNLLEVVFTPLNKFIAALPTYMQLTDNSVYKNAKFYYAEADSVECLVNVFGDDFYNEDGTLNENSIIRDRFVQSIVGYKSGSEWVDGMVWGILKTAGLDVGSISYADVINYLKLDYAGRAQFAATNAEKALSIEVYLAFEKAVVASKDSSVTLETVMGVGDIDTSAFSDILKAVEKGPAVVPADVLDAACEFVAATATKTLNDTLNANLASFGIEINVTVTADDIKAIYLAEDVDATTTACKEIADRAANAIITAAKPVYKAGTIAGICNGFAAYLDTFKGIYGVTSDEEFVNAFYNDSLTGYATLSAFGVLADPAFAAAAPAAAQAAASIQPEYIDAATEIYIEGALGLTTAGVDIRDYINSQIVGILPAAVKTGVASLATVLTLSDTLGDAIIATPALTGILSLFGRCVIGNGLGGHPSIAGHKALFEALKKAYVEDYTAQDETFKNVKEALELLADLVANYYDEAYAYGYAYAVENGYVAMAEAAIDDAIAAIAAIEVDNELIDAELKAALEAELTAVVNTLFELKVAVTTNKAGTVEGLVEVVFALEDDLYAHLANAEAILLLAGEDVYEQALAQIEILKNKIETEVIPQIEAYVNAMLLKAQDYIVTKIAEAFGIVVDINDSIEEKLAKICAYIETVYGIVLDTQATVEATIENTIKAICGYIADIYNIALDAKATAMEMVQQIYNYFAKLYGDSVAAFDKAVEAFREYLAKTHTCEYLVSDDSYYVAIDGNDYANILAEKLNLTEEQVKLVTWDELTVEDIAKADLITISYDNNTVLAFAAEQLLGYTKNYIDGTLRNDAKEYLNDVLVSLELLKAEAIENVIGNVDTAIDYIIMEEPVASMGVTALDWAALIGEENSEYVANVKAEIANALAEAGIPATYEVPVPVVEMLYEYRVELGLEELFDFVDVDTLYKKLGENAYYTLEIPVMDMMVLAAESAVYEYVRYNKNYSETVAAINMINPDAAVALLGSYNLFDGIDFGVDSIGVEAFIDVAELIKLVGFDKFIGEEYAIDTVEISAIFTVDEIYDAFAIASSVQPMAYAAMYENVFFVDIRDVETNLEEAIAYGFLDGSVLSILEGYLFGIDTEPSVAGNEYIAEQIYNALIVTCDHIYDDVCIDADCNRCGEIREASGHSFTNYVSNGDATCTADGTKTAVCDNGCGEEDTIADEGSKLAHKFVTYTSNGDATCNSDGTKTASCEYDCGAKDTIVDEGSKLTHKFVTYTSNGDATCNSDGTKTATCANGCGAKDTIVDEGSKLTHKFVTYVSDGNATCTSDGTKTAVCANGCGARDTVVDTGSMKIHNFILVVDHTDATCLVAESTTFRCATCPETNVVVGALADHVPGEAATCTTAQVCTVCNAEIAAATGHKAGAAATCTTAQTCTVCNEELAAATGHKAGAAATCTTAQTCTVCKVELVAATGHKAGAAATCTTAQTCTVCKAELAPATGHKAGAAATCTAAQTCTVCNEELAAAIAHNFADATCKAPKTCTVCNATEGEAAAHTYANACDVDCDVCGATRTTEHTYGDWTVTVEPTAKADGKQERTCTGCGAVDSEVVPATGSALSVGVIVGIVVAALAVVGGGVFVVLFLLKKKRA